MHHRLRLAASLALTLSPTALQAQDMVPTSTRVLTIYRESVKPGKNAAHDAHETAWTRALVAAKAPGRFLAMTAMSGANENWYAQLYDSWAAYEKETAANRANPALAAIQKQFSPREDEFLSDGRLMTLRERPELGYGGPLDMGDSRYLSVTRVSVRPGHILEYEEIRKIVKQAHETAHLADKYSMWEATSGAPTGTFYVMVAHKSLAELDDFGPMHAGTAYMAALGGDDGQKKLAALTASAVISSEADHFEFSPSQSFAPDAWVAANPKFWKAPAVAVAPATAKKPPAKTP